MTLSSELLHALSLRALIRIQYALSCVSLRLLSSFADHTISHAVKSGSTTECEVTSRLRYVATTSGANAGTPEALHQ